MTYAIESVATSEGTLLDPFDVLIRYGLLKARWFVAIAQHGPESATATMLLAGDSCPRYHLLAQLEAAGLLERDHSSRPSTYRATSAVDPARSVLCDEFMRAHQARAPVDAAVLVALATFAPGDCRTAAQLATRADVSPGAMPRIMGRLKAIGMIERRGTRYWLRGWATNLLPAPHTRPVVDLSKHWPEVAATLPKRGAAPPPLPRAEVPPPPPLPKRAAAPPPPPASSATMLALRRLGFADGRVWLAISDHAPVSHNQIMATAGFNYLLYSRLNALVAAGEIVRDTSARPHLYSLPKQQPEVN